MSGDFDFDEKSYRAGITDLPPLPDWAREDRPKGAWVELPTAGRVTRLIGWLVEHQLAVSVALWLLIVAAAVAAWRWLL